MSEEKKEFNETPVDSHKNFFAKELGIRRRGRPTVIDEERNSATEARVKLNIRQERIVKSIQKELGLSANAITKRFVDEGIKRWANQGRDKFDLSHKVKEVYEKTVNNSINPIATQVLMMNEKIDVLSEELAHLAIEIGSLNETENKADSEIGKQNQTALRLLLSMNRDVMAQNELLVEMLGHILKWTPAFQTGSGSGARADEEEYDKFLLEAKKRIKAKVEADVRKIIQEDKAAG